MTGQNLPAILTPEQAEFLSFLSSQAYFRERYYLTGGTALAACYLHHRYSEDLDFFTAQAEVDLLAAQQLIHRAKADFRLKKVAYQNYYGLHAFFLTYPNDNVLKVDFSYYPFPQIEPGTHLCAVPVDSVRDIAANKLQSVSTRTNARDYVDLYCIVQSKKYRMEELVKLARAKFDCPIDPIQPNDSSSGSLAPG